MIKEIAFVAYPVTDMKAARAFYEQSLGLKLAMNYEDMWVEYDVGGGSLAISTMLEGHQPSAKGAAVALEVDDISATAADLRAKGVKFLLDVTTTPVCRMAAVADPDGNGIVIHQRNQP